MTTNTIETRAETKLNWLVVNPEGKLLAVLDSESEAYWFTKNRGHANGAVYFSSACDYAAAPELLEALEVITALCYELAMKSLVLTPSVDRIIPAARAAIAKAKA